MVSYTDQQKLPDNFKVHQQCSEHQMVRIDTCYLSHIEGCCQIIGLKMGILANKKGKSMR